MSYVIRFVGLSGGRTSDYDGKYLRDYDPSTTFPGCPPEHQRAGDCWLLATDDPLEARRYASFLEAMAEWNRVDEREPVRPDGKPNKPLTQFSIVVDPVE